MDTSNFAFNYHGIIAMVFWHHKNFTCSVLDLIVKVPQIKQARQRLIRVILLREVPQPDKY